MFFYALGRTPRDSHSSSIRSSSAIKSRFPQAHLAFRMHRFPRSSSVIKKPLSASANRIQHAPHLASRMHRSSRLLQPHNESHFPQVPSASRNHCSLRIRSVTPKATLRECPLHPECIAPCAPAALRQKPLPESAPASSMHCSQRPSGVIESHSP